jgi:predicted NAD/FAD-binding protein
MAVRMRIAVVGGGVSGLVAAHLLGRRHEVTVFEAAGHAGGHTNTVDVDGPGGRVAIDTGFIVYNDRTYPLFSRLLARLGVATRATSMSFSVRCDRSALEYNGTSLNGVFADRRHLVSPGFWRMLADILRFNRDGAEQAQRANGDSVGAFLRAHGYGGSFRDHYLLPMGASIWSCPPRAFLDFPIAFVIAFFDNHGLLRLRDRPEWRVVAGGSARYVERLVAPLGDRLRLRTPVLGLARRERHVDVRTGRGVEAFDEVVVACHADQALALVEDPSPEERLLLGAFPYQRNTAVLHTDASWLPRRRRAWAAWNYRVPAQATSLPTVTYHMNRLQHLEAPVEYCVSLNPAAPVAAGTELGRYAYAHPVFSHGRTAAQREHHTVIRRRRTSYCGAYWGYGFHEDGVRSAAAVAAAYGEALD